MLRRSLLFVALLAAAAAAVAVTTASGLPSPVFQASVVDIQRPVSTASYSTIDYARHKTGKPLAASLMSICKASRTGSRAWCDRSRSMGYPFGKRPHDST